MFRKTASACFALFVIACPAYSGAMGEVTDTQTIRPLIMLSGGPAWQSDGKTQTFTLQPTVQNAYVANKNTSALGSGAIYLAIQGPFYKSVLANIGVAFTGSGTAKLSGEVWQDASPDFSNFTYNYEVNQFRVAFKARLVETDPKYLKAVKPYLSGEVGGGANRSTRYFTTRTIDTAVLQPPFANNTVLALTYAFGAGLQGNVTPHVQVGVGYEFANWGKNNLGIANGQTTPDRLGSSHLYVNELQFSVLYTV
ncbi:MAG: porin family protein [Legionellaceae bacterium]|nr:porin family protein [Legionellaceae bacterium]